MPKQERQEGDLATEKKKHQSHRHRHLQLSNQVYPNHQTNPLVDLAIVVKEDDFLSMCAKDSLELVVAVMLQETKEDRREEKSSWS